MGRLRRPTTPTLYGTGGLAGFRVNLATLNVRGKSEALSALKGVLPFSLDSAWSKGDRRGNGMLHEASGFSGTISDCATPGEMVAALVAFFSECTSRNIGFADEALEAELSIGVTVGDSSQFTASVNIPHTLLASLTASSISLSFTAYPTSDDANATGST